MWLISKTRDKESSYVAPWALLLDGFGDNSEFLRLGNGFFQCNLALVVDLLDLFGENNVRAL